MKMIMTNDAVSTTSLPPLPTDKQILRAVKKRYDLNPNQEQLIFEIGGLGAVVNNENDYQEIITALGGLKEKAGIDYTIEDTYTDRRGRTQHYILYESRQCKVKINDREKFGNYCKDNLQDNSTETSSQQTIGSHPYCVVESGWGYLKFGKFGKKKKIGQARSRPFRLLQCLLEPLGVAKTVDSVFEAIRLPKDKGDSGLNSWSTAQTRQVEIIRNTIKELQKGNKLDGKIIFEFNEAGKQIMARLIG
jgi:hypothetical protein